MLRKLFVFLAAIVASTMMMSSTAIAAPSNPPNYEKKCRNVTADATYFIPKKFVEKDMPSPSGAYGYRSGCPFWVVDYSLNNISNTDDSLVPQPVIFYGTPYDLPSSESNTGVIPRVEEDCKRLYIEYFIYKKFKHEATFVVQMHVTAKGEWNTTSQRCTLLRDSDGSESYFEIQPPQANVLVVRVVTRVKLRTSWQEAAGLASDGPPT